MSVPKIKCPECCGNGQVSMPAKLRSSYLALKKIEPATIAQFCAVIGGELSKNHHLMKRLVRAGAAKKVSKKMPAKYATV